eukprot:3715346-Prymnesium_polylepis.3
MRKASIGRLGAAAACLQHESVLAVDPACRQGALLPVPLPAASWPGQSLVIDRTNGNLRSW